jgi:hypothetical protein
MPELASVIVLEALTSEGPPLMVYSALFPRERSAATESVVALNAIETPLILKEPAPELQRRLFEEGYDNPKVVLAGEDDAEFVARGALKAARRARESQWQQMLGATGAVTDTGFARRGGSTAHQEASDTVFQRQSKHAPEPEDERVPAH